MSVGVPGAYRWMSWRPRYTPELVAMLLPTVWGQPAWHIQDGPLDRCTRTAGKCTHTCDDDEFGEGCVVDGDHKDCRHRHGGHAQCGKCTCVDPKSRRSTDDRDSDVAVMRIDIERAWRLAPMSLEIAQALVLRHAGGLTQEDIARTQGVSQQAVSLRLKAGHMAIADYLNGR